MLDARRYLTLNSLTIPKFEEMEVNRPQRCTLGRNPDPVNLAAAVVKTLSGGCPVPSGRGGPVIFLRDTSGGVVISMPLPLHLRMSLL
jgi:hypothetical protein